MWTYKLNRNRYIASYGGGCWIIQLYIFLCDKKFMRISEYNITLVRVCVWLKEFMQILLIIRHHRMTNIITTIYQTKSTKSSSGTKHTNNWLLCMRQLYKFYHQPCFSFRSHWVACRLNNYCFIKFRPRSYSSGLWHRTVSQVWNLILAVLLPYGASLCNQITLNKQFYVPWCTSFNIILNVSNHNKVLILIL
jgi:hypothetical protein